MKTLRVYVDASVIGGCFDAEFASERCALLDMARAGDIMLLVSELLLFELSTAPQTVREVLGSLPEACVELVPVSLEADRLGEAYVAAGVVGPASENDARHVAYATAARADLIVSWSFRHIVHFDKIRGYNAVNIREGYGLIAIHTPKEVV